MRSKADEAQRGAGLATAAFAVLLGNALLIASAKTQIPFWPVPMTLQMLVVVLLGLVTGPRLGALTVALYLLEGAAGIPVFAGTPERGIGIAYMAGPTGGYLAGFLGAAWLSGFCAERGWAKTRTARSLSIAAAFALVYALGATWLSSFVGASAAIKLGIVPFLLGDAVKLLLGVALLEMLGKVRDRLAPSPRRPD